MKDVELDAPALTTVQGGAAMLFVLNSLAIGGSEIKIIKVANALACSGVSVEIAYLNPPHTGFDKIDPAVSVTHLQRRGKYSVRSLRNLRDLANGHQAVVAVNLYPLLYVVPATKWMGSEKVKAVGLVNTSKFDGSEIFVRQIYAPFLRRCDQVVFGCVEQQEDWIRKYRLTRSTSQVIYNGVEYEAFSPAVGVEEGMALRQKLGIPPSAVVIGAVGRLAPEKNFDLLVRAAARLRAVGRDSYTVIVGQGPERARLEKLAVAEGVGDRIRFIGLRADVRPPLTMMDVFVLPSRSVETFSNAALEAMSMARAVALSQIGGAAEMVEHGKSGMLFPAGSLEALTDVLSQLHDSSDMRRTLGAAARDRVSSMFDFRNMVRQYRALLSTE